MNSPTGKGRPLNPPPGRESIHHAELEEAGKRIVEAERRRIAQDIHDGVASQLVSLIATLDPAIPQQQRIIGALEASLLELKFIVDSLVNQSGSVVEALASLRYRIQPALERHGITMEWTMEDALPLETLVAERSIHVLRIAQEALNNVLLHSGAKTVCVSCTFNELNCCLELLVSDNGCGLTGATRRGQGLTNMNNRAKAVGGNLQISRNGTSGTEIRLTVPLDVNKDELDHLL